MEYFASLNSSLLTELHLFIYLLPQVLSASIFQGDFLFYKIQKLE